MNRNFYYSTLRRLLSLIGLCITKCSTLDTLINTSRQHRQLSSTLKFLEHINNYKLREALNIVEEVKSQIQQDLFVLLAHDFKRNGYFVDFGATNGVDINNSWILEKKFGWSGIVSEPGRRWQHDLSNNRKCHISTKCVWKESGKTVLFNETDDGGFSTIDTYSFDDHHSESRKHGKKYQVETTSLNDLLASLDAPKEIDYLSIDTEGSELDILAEFDFEKWDISIITVEHNYTNNREKIRTLLQSKGFIRVLSSISQFDDWYIKPKLMDNLRNSFLLSLEDEV